MKGFHINYTIYGLQGLRFLLLENEVMCRILLSANSSIYKTPIFYLRRKFDIRPLPFDDLRYLKDAL